MSEWNAGLYEERHSFVWEHGRGLVALAAPRAGERILDVGCGTGQLTAELARAGSRVLGVDSSEAMIAQARENFPDLAFEIGDARALRFHEEFDAVFSNAALHWVKEAEAAVAGISRALARGGRFVAEFGGHGNVRRILDAVFAALDSFGLERVEPWYFPTVGEYTAVLERQGLEVRYATLFDRPIALEGGERGMANWIAMFGQQFLAKVDAGQRDEFVERVAESARPALFRDGQWTADYRRLQVSAVKV